MMYYTVRLIKSVLCAAFVAGLVYAACALWYHAPWPEEEAAQVMVAGLLRMSFVVGYITALIIIFGADKMRMQEFDVEEFHARIKKDKK